MLNHRRRFDGFSHNLSENTKNQEQFCSVTASHSLQGTSPAGCPNPLFQSVDLPRAADVMGMLIAVGRE